MKITVHGPRAGYGPGGVPAGIESWGVDQVVEVDDGDKKAVTWARMFVATGAATLIEDAAAPVRRGPGRPPKVPAEPSGE